MLATESAFSISSRPLALPLLMPFLMIRAAVTVFQPMPSPMNKITFLGFLRRLMARTDSYFAIARNGPVSSTPLTITSSVPVVFRLTSRTM